jgi:hypothetical protein
MAVTRRATYLQSPATHDVDTLDPECAVTARIERVAVGLAVLAGWFAPGPLPTLPPRRTRVSTGGPGAAGPARTRFTSSELFASRSA